MGARFKEISHDQPLLLPVDLRDWVPEDDLVHFVLATVKSLDLSSFRVNERGTGSSQYPPWMMLSLLIYCYANGVFSSRRIERATYRDLSVRYLSCDTHPDHDTIAAFRKNNFEAMSRCFVKVLELARELKLLKVGTISVDGTKLRSNANKSRNVRYDRAKELISQLESEVAELMAKAEEADNSPAEDGQKLPKELGRLNKLKDKLEAAKKRIEERNRKRAVSEWPEYEKKVAARDKRKGRKKGPHPKKPDPAPEAKEQDNLTDTDSRLMKRSKREGYMQAYNAQAAVDADGSYLILGARVSQCASDRNELVDDLKAIPPGLGRPETILADNGYLCEEQIKKIEEPKGEDSDETGPEVLVSVWAEAKQLRRKHDFRPLPAQDKQPPKINSEFILKKKARMETDEAKAKYSLRKQTVEPVFGTIKKWMGFDQFLLRGLDKVSGEWQLVTLAYNFKRLWTMICAQKQPI